MKLEKPKGHGYSICGEHKQQVIGDEYMDAQDDIRDPGALRRTLGVYRVRPGVFPEYVLVVTV